MKYIHIGLIQIKITGLFRSGIDTPIMVVCMDERVVNNTLNAIIGGAKSNLANRLFGVNIHPDFCISLDDKNIEKACTLSLNLQGIELLQGSKVLGIQWEHCMALNDTATFRTITPKQFVETFEVGIGKTIQPRLVDIRHLRLDNDMQVFVKSLKPKVQMPVEYFIASGNTITTVKRFEDEGSTSHKPSESIKLRRSYSQQLADVEQEQLDEIPRRSSFRQETRPDLIPIEGRTKTILDQQEKNLAVKIPLSRLCHD